MGFISKYMYVVYHDVMYMGTEPCWHTLILGEYIIIYISLGNV